MMEIRIVLNELNLKITVCTEIIGRINLISSSFIYNIDRHITCLLRQDR